MRMIWPIVAGLYWPRATGTGAVAGMVAGTTVGLAVYVTIGWYAASLAGALASALVVGLTTWASSREFSFDTLSKGRAA